jgi:transcriptional regulator with XRE-family HTH domain
VDTAQPVSPSKMGSQKKFVDDISKRIRVLRFLRHMTAGTVRTKLHKLDDHTTYSAVYAITRTPRFVPTIKTCELLAEILGVNIGDLFVEDKVFDNDPFLAEVFSYREKLNYNDWTEVFSYMKRLSAPK